MDIFISQAVYFIDPKMERIFIMGRQTREKVLSFKESVRKSAMRFTEHMTRKQGKAMMQVYDAQVTNNNLSFQLYSHLSSLIRNTLETKKPSTNKNDLVSTNCSYEENMGEPKNEFQEKLLVSTNSFRKTSEIFKGPSLREKYWHLIDGSQPRVTSFKEALTNDQDEALSIIRQIYFHYKVSHIKRKHLHSKISSHFIDILVQKGYLKLHNKNVNTGLETIVGLVS